MTRPKKVLLIAIFVAVSAWLVGTMLVGAAEMHWYTASGTVNMLDAHAVEQALRDPTFTASLSWGSLTLVGRYWTFILPMALALAIFVLTLVVGNLLDRRLARKPH